MAAGENIRAMSKANKEWLEYEESMPGDLGLCPVCYTALERRYDGVWHCPWGHWME